MKTDLSRSTFDPAKRLSSVRLQQGRMQLDADWNEQIDILAHHEALTLTDIIGPAGGPLDSAGFGIASTAADLDPTEAARPANLPVPALAADDFLITAGHYYVAGLLAQNPAIGTYLTQEDFPNPPTLSDPGIYMAFLDVWDRPLTYLEDPSIREVALGGPNTATRTRRIWQVRTVRVAAPGDDVTCMDSFAAFTAATTAPSGQLSARAEPGAVATGPCVVPETAGYRSLENQLYRVEVHTSGTRTTARFKWSRENGSVVTSWLSQNGDEATVASAGPDRTHGFANGDWVELIDEGRELRGEPGTMVRLLDVRDNVLVFDPATADGPTTLASFPSQPRIRRWDGVGLFAASGAAWGDLEQGVQVRFQTGDYRTADHWMIPARTNTGDVEWPRNGAGTPIPQAPDGIVHAYSRLGLITFDGTDITATEDCRTLFPPLSGLLQIDYAGGDGQQGMPDLVTPAAGATLAEPLRAAVSNGGRAIAGATVRFAIDSGAGMLDGGTTPVNVVTNASGIASVNWLLGATGPDQRVVARLLDHASTALHVPLIYSASHSIAQTTAFDPVNCPPLAAARTVQEAIDILCRQGGGDEPGFTIRDMVWRSGDRYEHDGRITFDMLMRGLEIQCDDNVDPTTIKGRPVVFISALRPLDNELLTVEMRLSALLDSSANIILWAPNPDIAGPLLDIFKNFEQPALFELTIRGDNIRAQEPAPDGSPRWLDAEGLEQPGRVILPSGDQRSGGTLVSWFRVEREDQGGNDFRFIDVVRLDNGGLSGRLVETANGAGVPGVPILMRDQSGASIGAATTRVDGTFRLDQTPNGAVVLEATFGVSTARFDVPATRRLFGEGDFTIDTTDAIPGLSEVNRGRLRARRLTDPSTVANLTVAELAQLIDVSETLSRRILTTVRAAANRI